MSSQLISGIIGLLAFAGMMYVIVRRHKDAGYRPLSSLKRETDHPISQELGMEAMDMELVNAVENENRRLAKKSGANQMGRSNIHRNTHLPRFKKSGDK